MTGAVRIHGPDARQAIGLQLQPDRERIGVRFGGATTSGVYLVHDAQQILHMVTDLVRDDVSAREVSGGLKAVGEFLEERKVEIDLAVARTIERSHCRLGEAAGRIDGAGIEDKFRVLVSRAERSKLFGPGILGVGEHHGNEILQLRLLRAGRRLRHIARGIAAEIALEQLRRIHAEQQGDNDDRDEAEAADPGTAAGNADSARHTHPAGKPAAALAAAIFDVVASSTAAPAHDALYSLWDWVHTPLSHQPLIKFRPEAPQLLARELLAELPRRQP